MASGEKQSGSWVAVSLNFGLLSRLIKFKLNHCRKLKMERGKWKLGWKQSGTPVASLGLIRIHNFTPMVPSPIVSSLVYPGTRPRGVGISATIGPSNSKANGRGEVRENKWAW